MSSSEVVQVSIPSTLENPEIASEVDHALRQRDHADYECFQLLDKLLDEVPTTELAKLLAKSTLIELEEAHEFLDECKEVIQQRKDANERFLMALAGKL
jgi:hypothetical protein